MKNIIIFRHGSTNNATQYQRDYDRTLTPRGIKDAEKMGAFEPVFINNDNYVTECAIRNIFFIKNKTLLTPTLDLGVLPGVMRSTIIEIAYEMGISTEESYIAYSEIDKMSEAFISSTGIGLLPCCWDEWSSKFELTKKISAELDRRIQTPG